MSSQYILSGDKQPYSEISDFLIEAKDEIVIFSPYINPSVLRNILPEIKPKTSIITTWKLQDIWLGSSSLETFTYTKENSIKLFINNRIHLKVYMIDWQRCISGSANLTERGLGISPSYNYELISKHKNIDPVTSLYFRSIIAESKLVTEGIYEEYKKALSDFPDIPIIPSIDVGKDGSEKEFLISSLPMSYNIDSLYKLYSNKYETENVEERNCALHDVALYSIPKSLSRNDFYDFLSKAFFASLFIRKLLDFISEEGRYFGEVKEWIQKNCSDVPVPSRRDLTGNIQVLYKWIVELSDGHYAITTPNYSEKIYKVK